MLSAGLLAYIPFDRESQTPFYVQIYEGFRSAILSGRLGPGERLPSTRTLAADLQISRLPVLIAFEQLLHEGYLVGKVGSGTYVIDRIPDEVARPIPWRRPVSKAVAPDAMPMQADAVGMGGGHGLFRIGLPALDQFPHQSFSRLIRKHASSRDIDLLGFAPPAGHLPLRQAIVEYLRSTRAVDCDARQVLITSGSQMALRIAATALLTSGSALCIEDPGYQFARTALDVSQARLIPIRVDDEGIDVPAIISHGPDVRAVYVTPSHQFPLGMSMSIARRRALLDWAETNDAWIIEDDYDGEFRYAGRPLGSLQGMDTSGRVIHMGTFSKVLCPAVRLGYVVVPRELVDDFVSVRRSIDLFSPLLYQLVLTDFLRSGQFASHLRRMRKLYRSRRDALMEAVDTTAADVLALGNADAGLHIVAFLDEERDDLAIVEGAQQHGLLPWALSACYMSNRPRQGLLLGFGGSDELSLVAGVRSLAALIRRSSTRSRQIRA